MENTEEIYTDFARVYDELMDNTPYDMWCDRLDELITAYGVSKPTRDAEGILDSERNLVVDLGCGTGTLTELLYKKGYDCIGVDNSEEMLNIAMDKKTQSGSAIVFWNIAYPDDTFTLVYAPVPGICGTGVTSKEITLPDSNLSGWKYTEIYQTEQKYWIYITLSNPDIPLQGNTLQLKATLPLTAWDALEADFNRILETVRLQYTSYETPVMQDILILPTPKTEFR